MSNNDITRRPPPKETIGFFQMIAAAWQSIGRGFLAADNIMATAEKGTAVMYEVTYLKSEHYLNSEVLEMRRQLAALQAANGTGNPPPAE